jgi:hypothetical protein
MVYLFQKLHDEYISSTWSRYSGLGFGEVWYIADADNVSWDPNDDEIPF